MIRRDAGDSFLLIMQNDHARLAGEMAEAFGNDRFAAPEPFAGTIAGVTMHDSGWPLHDDQPTLNKDGHPLDVFETPRAIALKVWAASADRAAAQDPYAGLLTSLHVLSLSVFASSQSSFHDTDDSAALFAVSKFQQHEIERQEQLRVRCGLRTERIAHGKVPKETLQKAEDQLTFNFRMLQAMDLLSLAACCTAPPANETQDVFEKPAGAKLRLAIRRDGDDVIVAPWPFKQPDLELMIPVSRIARARFENEKTFHAALAAGGAEVLTCRVRPSAS